MFARARTAVEAKVLNLNLPFLVFLYVLVVAYFIDNPKGRYRHTRALPIGIRVGIPWSVCSRVGRVLVGTLLFFFP